MPSAKPPKQLSSKIWEKIVPLLNIQGDYEKICLLFIQVKRSHYVYIMMPGGVAKFGSRSLVTSSGLVTGPDLPDGASIH